MNYRIRTHSLTPRLWRSSMTQAIHDDEVPGAAGLRLAAVVEGGEVIVDDRTLDEILAAARRHPGWYTPETGLRALSVVRTLAQPVCARRRHISVRVDVDTIERLDETAATLGIDRSTAVRRAISHLIERQS